MLLPAATPPRTGVKITTNLAGWKPVIRMVMEAPAGTSVGIIDSIVGSGCGDGEVGVAPAPMVGLALEAEVAPGSALARVRAKA